MGFSMWIEIVVRLRNDSSQAGDLCNERAGCAMRALRFKRPTTDEIIGIGGVVAHSPLPHHRTCGSASGGSEGYAASSYRVTCWTFGIAFRRKRFGPFPRSLWSFTPLLLGKGQLVLVFLPLVAHRVLRPTCRSLLFGPSSLSRLLRPLLTSAARSE